MKYKFEDINEDNVCNQINEKQILTEIYNKLIEVIARLELKNSTGEFNSKIEQLKKEHELLLHCPKTQDKYIAQVRAKCNVLLRDELQEEEYNKHMVV